MPFAILKALLRRAAERTVNGLCTAIGRFVDVFTSRDCANYSQPQATMQIDPTAL